MLKLRCEDEGFGRFRDRAYDKYAISKGKIARCSTQQYTSKSTKDDEKSE